MFLENVGYCSLKRVSFFVIELRWNQIKPRIKLTDGDTTAECACLLYVVAFSKLFLLFGYTNYSVTVRCLYFLCTELWHTFLLKYKDYRDFKEI